MIEIGDYYYKKNIWEDFWEYRHTAINESIAHDVATTRLKTVKLVLDVIVTGATALTGIFAGINSDDSTSVIATSMVAVLTKAVETSSGLNSRIQSHQVSATHFKFLAQDINRIMSLKRTTTSMKENMEIVSNLMSSFQQQAPIVPGWICFTPKVMEPVPRMPVSPIDSCSPSPERRRSPSPTRVDVDWVAADMYVTAKHPLLREFFNNPNNVAHYQNDINGIVTDVDDNCCTIVGLEREEILTPTGFGWSSKLHKLDQSYIFAQWNEACNNQTTFLEKYRFVPDNQTSVYVIAEAQPLFKNRIYQGHQGILITVPDYVFNEIDIETIKKKH
jgi:PAS domain-containing protein